MRLVLRLDSPGEAPVEREFDERGGVIGRSSECDWVLECPQKLISRRHAVIAFDQDRFWLYDASANGVFHNQSAEPIGAGWRVPLEDGDSFRMGDFVAHASIVDGAASPQVQAEPVPVEAPQIPSAPELAVLPSPTLPKHPERPIEALDFGTLDSRRASTAPLQQTLANTLDEFQPPRVFIPDDWDFALEASSDAQREAPTAVVSRQLMGRQVQAREALWAALLPGDSDYDAVPEITPELAAALGRSLRVCIDGLIALRTEFDTVEQELTGKARAPEGADADALCRALFAESNPDATVTALECMAKDMCGKHTDVVSGFRRSVDTIIGQFTPKKFEERWERHKKGEAGSKAPVSRVTSRLGLKTGFWGFYNAWHDEQLRIGYKAVHRLFEKMFLSIYTGRRQGEPGRAAEQGSAKGDRDR